MTSETLLKEGRRRDLRAAEPITDFLVKYDKYSREKKLLIWKSGRPADAVEIDLARDYSFIIGYQYEGLAGLAG
jgi:hypothetical protein